MPLPPQWRHRRSKQVALCWCCVVGRRSVKEDWEGWRERPWPDGQSRGRSGRGCGWDCVAFVDRCMYVDSWSKVAPAAMRSEDDASTTPTSTTRSEQSVHKNIHRAMKGRYEILLYIIGMKVSCLRVICHIRFTNESNGYRIYGSYNAHANAFSEINLALLAI